MSAGPSQAGYVLFSGAERTLTRDERVDGARELELLARRQRARRDRDRVEIEPHESGSRTFRVVSRRDGVEQRVTLRGPEGRRAACTCQDYASNELQSCRHVERVRMWSLRKKKPAPGHSISVW